MSAPIWQTPAGFLGTLTERQSASVPLQATGTDIKYTLISGSLPVGLKLNSTSGLISGTPTSVPVDTLETFVVRAQNTDGLRDRTFSFNIVGPSEPSWSTLSGLLPVGLNGELFAFNKSYVDFNFRAETDILASGNRLKYYIEQNEGTLPPGLRLSDTGRIYGFVDDILKLDVNASLNGGYDDERYDGYPYDHSILNNQVVEAARPVSINKLYEFFVTVTDGISSSKRKFAIEIVDPDSFRTDNTLASIDDINIDASAGYLLAPLWQGPYGDFLPPVANLGIIRASRNQVITLREYDPYPFVGPIVWDWSTSVNPEIKLFTDSVFNQIGRPTANLQFQSSLSFKDAKIFPVKGMKIRLNEYLSGFDNTVYTITGVIKTGNNKGILNLDRPLTRTVPDSQMIYVGSASQKPPGLQLDTATGEIYGFVPYQPAYSTTYRFTVKIIKTDSQTQTQASTSKIFTLTVKGDITSYIQFTSPSILGTLKPGEISELQINAVNVNSDYALQYTLIGGLLPKGLTLNNDGSIQGRIEYNSQTRIDFDYNIPETFQSFTLDGGSTTIDKKYTFAVRASDVYKLSAVDQDFTIAVNEDSLKQYTRIYVKPFMAKEKRDSYASFINDPVIFDPNLLYRPEDPEFGLQPNIKMLLETGIEKVSIEKYVDAMSQFFRRKRFYFGDVKVIKAKNNLFQDVYELVYVDIIDNQMKNSSTPIYSDSVGNMQIRLQTIMLDSTTYISVDEQLRPKYMRTEQLDTGIPVGFIKAVPLCYVKPGSSDKILSRIKTSGFDFKEYDFDTDRIIVETPLEENENGWLFYPTDRQ